MAWIEQFMSGVEFAEWVAFNNFVTPLPDPWRQAGVVAAAVANFSGNVKRSAYPLSADAFVPAPRRPRAPVPWQVQQAKMRVYAAKHQARNPPKSE